jgi:hypothetical protein
MIYFLLICSHQPRLKMARHASPLQLTSPPGRLYEDEAAVAASPPEIAAHTSRMGIDFEVASYIY